MTDARLRAIIAELERRSAEVERQAMEPSCTSSQVKLGRADAYAEVANMLRAELEAATR